MKRSPLLNRNSIFQEILSLSLALIAIPLLLIGFVMEMIAGHYGSMAKKSKALAIHYKRVVKTLLRKFLPQWSE